MANSRQSLARWIWLVPLGVVLAFVLVWIASQTATDRARGLAGPPNDAHTDGTLALRKPDLADVESLDVRRTASAHVDHAADDRATREEPKSALAPRLRGVLVRPDGGPTGPGHVVALLELGPDGAPRPDGGRAVLTPDEDGRFEVPLPDWAFTSSVALVGRAPSLVPATLVLRPVRGAPIQDVVLTLTEGERFRGRVTWRGEALAGWPIDLDLRFGVPGVSGANEEAFWLGGQLVEKVAHATADVDGRFEFTGLVADRYDLRCGRPSPSAPNVFTETVQVGGAELSIDLATAGLEVAVLGAGGALADADVLATCAEGEVRVRTTGRPMLLEFPPFTEVTLRVEHPTYTTLEERFITGAVGSDQEALLVLRPAVRPALRVHLPGAHAAQLEQLDLDLVPLSGAGGARDLQVKRAEELDVYWLAALPASPGPHALRLASVGAFRSEVKELEVPAAGILDVAFRGALGGRFRVEVTSALVAWSAEWRVLDEAGRDVRPAVQQFVTGPGEAFAWSTSTNAEIALAPDHEVVPAGPYRVEVESAEHNHESRVFDVRVGETTVVEVELTPK